MKFAFFLTVISGLLFLVPPSQAESDLFGASGLDAAFCKLPNSRQTVVYIDDTMMVDGKQDWAIKLAGKLRATLAPGEKVTVVRLSPSNGQSNEIWGGCWPEYSAAERAKIEGGSYIFSRSPLDSLPEQKKFFMRDLDRALSAIYGATKRPQSAVHIDSLHPPEKNIIRALAFDEGRFAQSKMTIRAIVYSDLAENNDLGSVFKPGGPVENYGKKLGTYLRRSVFYVYGMAEDVSNAPAVLEEARRFWAVALSSMNATVGGLGTDLNMQNAVPVLAKSFVIDLARDGQTLDGRLSILADADGNLVDSWVQVMRLSISTLSGTFRCQGSPQDPTCKLTAKTGSGVVTQTAQEEVLLTGSIRSGLTGDIGVKGALTYGLKATAAED
jgi:hypothetical protein